MPAQYIELSQISPNRPEHECPHQGFHLALHNFGNSHKSNHMDQGNINRHGPIDRSRAVVVLYQRGNVFDHLNREIHGDIMKMLLRNMIKDSFMVPHSESVQQPATANKHREALCWQGCEHHKPRHEEGWCS